MIKHFGISRILILLCLPAALWLISNNYVNQHYHILSNGKIISHSHPHCNCSNNPIQDHHHTDFEYSILAQLASNSSSENVEGFSVDFTTEPNKKHHTFFYDSIIAEKFIKLPDLRAPPVL